jgi:uncharacterized membrane protein (DUF2068 family)
LSNWGYNAASTKKHNKELRMNRPTGVSVIAVLCFIGAVFCLIGGIGLIAGGGFLATMLSQQAESAGAASILAGLGTVVGVLILVFGAVYVLVGWGLWMLKEWARIVSIVLSAIAAVFQLPGLLTALLHFRIGSFIWIALWTGVYAAIIWYLLKPAVKAVFQRSAGAAAA